MKKILCSQITTKNSTGSNSGKLQPMQQNLKKLQSLKKTNKPQHTKQTIFSERLIQCEDLLGQMHF